MWKYNKYIQYSTNCGMPRATCTNTFIYIYEHIEHSTHIYLNTSLWQLHPFHYCHSHIFCCATFTAFCLAYASIHKYYLVIVASSSLFTCNNSNQRHCNCCWILKITQRATCHQFFTVALVCFTRNFFLPSFQLVCVCVCLFSFIMLQQMAKYCTFHFICCLLFSLLLFCMFHLFPWGARARSYTLLLLLCSQLSKSFSLVHIFLKLHLKNLHLCFANFFRFFFHTIFGVSSIFLSVVCKQLDLLLLHALVVHLTLPHLLM